MKFLADDVPFRFVLGVDGSNDLAIEHPGVTISVDADQVSALTDFLEPPLERICECYFLVGDRKRSYIANRCTEVDNLPGRLGVVDTDGESVGKRDNSEVTVVKIVSHG